MKRDEAPLGARDVEGPDGRVTRCRRHPTLLSRGVCDACQLPYCDECFVELDLREETILCVDCALFKAGVRPGRHRMRAR